MALSRARLAALDQQRSDLARQAAEVGNLQPELADRKAALKRVLDVQAAYEELGNTVPMSAVIQQIQNDAMAAGTAVEVKGVVITAIDTYGNRTGDIWVQEPGGGEFSGVKVFGAPLDAIATLAVGDLVDITGGVKDEFALTSDTSMRKVTEIKPAEGGMLTVTKVGTGTVPTPAAVAQASKFSGVRAF
jgi:hypothetical protein